MKHLLFILFFAGVIQTKATVHIIRVWDGYFQFLPNTLTIQLGDTIEWLPLDQPSMAHTITSTSIPGGASSFDKTWQAPADTFFRYIPQVTGTFDYVCTPHENLGMTGTFLVEDSLVSIEEQGQQSLILYPNPTRDFISVSNPSEVSQITVFDNCGKGCYINQSAHGVFDLRHLPKGTYFVKVELIGKVPETFKLVLVD